MESVIDVFKEYVKHKHYSWAETKREKIEDVIIFFSNIHNVAFVKLTYKKILNEFRRGIRWHVKMFGGYKSFIHEKRFLNAVFEFYTRHFNPDFKLRLFEQFDLDLQSYILKKKYKSCSKRNRSHTCSVNEDKKKEISINSSRKKAYRRLKAKRKKRRIEEKQAEKVTRIRQIRQFLDKQ